MLTHVDTGEARAGLDRWNALPAALQPTVRPTGRSGHRVDLSVVEVHIWAKGGESRTVGHRGRGLYEHPRAEALYQAHIDAHVKGTPRANSSRRGLRSCVKGQWKVMDAHERAWKVNGRSWKVLERP